MVAARRAESVIFYLTIAGAGGPAESSLQRFRLIVLIAGFLLALPGWAARPEGLYSAEVEYEGNQQAAFEAALGEVLVKLTGRRDAAARAEVQPLIASAADYVQQFRSPSPGVLWVSFDGNSLAARLTELGQPVWGGERPSTLLWLAVDAGGGRRFVVASEAEAADEARLRQAAVDEAERRGLPLVLPLVDAEDRAHAPFSELWGGFDDAILEASRRYGVDAVLVGRLAAGDFDRGRWTLLAGDTAERWTGGVTDSIGRVADAFASRYAVVSTGESGAIRLVVSGVESVEDYGRISSFLDELTAVQALHLETVQADRIVYRVSLRGDAAVLDQAVRLGGLLEVDGPGSPTLLSYRVRR